MPWFFNFVKIISWFTVSNFYRSRQTPQMERFLSQPFRICLIISIKARFVDLLFLNLN